MFSDPNDINGKKIAVTGVIDGYTREQIEDLILSSGAKFTKAISGKTDYLIAGNILEDGRPYTEGSKYKAAKEKNVTIVHQDNFADFPLIQKMMAGTAGKSQQVALEARAIVKAERILSTEKAPPVFGDISSLLWVDKYKPKNVKDIVGSAETVKKLSDWLASWNSLNLNSSKGKGSGVTFKAALLSGPTRHWKNNCSNNRCKIDELRYR